jgi:large subunit ribosomal protein L25
MGNLSIKANLREKLGTGPTRAVRRLGQVPGIVYSKGMEGVTVAIDAKDASLVCNRFDSMTNVVELKVEDKIYKVLARQISLHPVTDSIEHIDFFALDGSNEISVDVPIRILGREKSVEIKRGGVVNVAKRSLRCRVNADNIPEAINVDVSEIIMGTPVTLGDISIPSGVNLVDKDLKQTILKITGKRSMAASDAEEEGGEETAEGAEENKEENAAAESK